MDLFLESMEKYENPIEKTKLIADFMPMAFLHLDEQKIYLLLSKVYSKLIPINSKQDPKNAEFGTELWNAFFLKFNLYIQQAFYKKEFPSFQPNLINLEDFSEKLKENNQPFPFDQARLISQFAQRKDHLEHIAKILYIQWLKDYFELDNFNATKEDLQIDNLNYLKFFLKTIALETIPNLNNSLIAFTDRVLDNQLFNLPEENLSFITAIFNSTLNKKNLNLNKENSLFHHTYPQAFTKFMSFLYSKFKETSYAFKENPDNQNLEKKAYFLSSKIHELIFTLKEKGLIKYFREEILIDPVLKDYFKNHPLEVSILTLDKLLLPHQEKTESASDFKLPPVDKKDPLTILNLLQFASIHQAKFKKYQNTA
jgi:hypothetical protein